MLFISHIINTSIVTFPPLFLEMINKSISNFRLSSTTKTKFFALPAGFCDHIFVTF